MAPCSIESGRKSAPPFGGGNTEHEIPAQCDNDLDPEWQVPPRVTAPPAPGGGA